jgi:DNA-binding NarL/FixJ family response regulator
MQLIFCETTGNWAAWLKGQVPGEVKSVETRRLDELWQQLDQHGGAIVALELTATRLETSLAAFWRLHRQYPRAVVVALAERSLSALEPVVREAGAAHFIASPRKLNELVELARYRSAAASFRDRSDDEEVPIEDRVFASLPWAG